MVRPVIDTFNEYKLIHRGSAMTAGDKLHPFSLKKVALRELSKTSDDIMSKPAENSASSKEMGSTSDSEKRLGTKRRLPDCPSCPSNRQPHLNNGVDVHLVYVRRKFKTDRGTKNSSISVSSLSSSILSGNPDNEEKNEAKVHQDKTKKCNEFFHSHQKTIYGFEPTASGFPTPAHTPVDLKRSSDHDRYAATDPQIPSCHDSNASVDTEKNCSQDCQTPADILHRPNNQRSSALVYPHRLGNQDLNAQLDHQRPQNQGSNTPVGPVRPASQDSEAPFDPRRTRKQEFDAPVDPQIPSFQDLNVPVILQGLSNQDCRALSVPRNPWSEDSNASAGPQNPSNPDCKGPVDPRRSFNRGSKSPFDPHRLSNQDSRSPASPLRLTNQDSNVPIGPQRLSNQGPKTPVDPQSWSNQDCKAPVNPQRPSDRDWEERYLQLQAFLKNCDQSSQEDYKRMLRSLTAAGRSRLALELEKRALNLLVVEGKELHRMHVLNGISEASLQEHASPSNRTPASQTHFQRVDTMHKSPF